MLLQDRAPGFGGGPAADTVIVVVNLDPHQPRETTVWLDGAALGLDVDAGFRVIDELTGAHFTGGDRGTTYDWTPPSRPLIS